MSRRKNGRNVHGILLLDKRSGVSSNQALQEVRRLFEAKKAGHTGSLDPLATGLLPLCFGEATKICGMMLEDDKRYQVEIRLGMVTDTGDGEGRIVQQSPVPEIVPDRLQECLQAFTGEIDQVPPIYSALKHGGKKLYEIARSGQTVQINARKIRIYRLSLLDFSDERLTLEVYCSKGTYIRSLAVDIGCYLGCGATVTALRRLQSGQFRLEQAQTIEQLSHMDLDELSANLIAVDQPLQALPALQLSEQQARSIKFGQSIQGIQPLSGKVRLYHETVFLGLGEMLLDGKLAPRKLFNLNDF